jgi:hypothetical protein
VSVRTHNPTAVPEATHSSSSYITALATVNEMSEALTITAATTCLEEPQLDMDMSWDIATLMPSVPLHSFPSSQARRSTSPSIPVTMADCTAISSSFPYFGSMHATTLVASSTNPTTSSVTTAADDDLDDIIRDLDLPMPDPSSGQPQGKRAKFQ